MKTVAMKDGVELSAGDVVTDFRGKVWTYRGALIRPRRIYVSEANQMTREFFPSVFGAEIVER